MGIIREKKLCSLHCWLAIGRLLAVLFVLAFASPIQARANDVYNMWNDSISDKQDALKDYIRDNVIITGGGKVDITERLADDSKFSGGDGSKDNPYLISNKQDLADFMMLKKEAKLSSCYRLTCDIVVNENLFSDGNRDENGMHDYELNKSSLNRYRWYSLSVASESLYSFKGIFNGDGHSISGLFFDNKNGMFSKCLNALIVNLTIKNSYLYANSEGKGYVGMIAGTAENTVFKNCHVENSVIYIEDRDCGGILGEAVKGVLIDNCSYDGEIYGKKIACTIGGIVNSSDDKIKITGCTTKGKMVVYLQDKEGYNSTEMCGILRYSRFGKTNFWGFLEKIEGAAEINDCQNWMDMIYINKCDNPNCKQDGDVSMRGIVRGSSNLTNCANYGNMSVTVNQYKKFYANMTGLAGIYSEDYNYEDLRAIRTSAYFCGSYGNMSFIDNSSKKTATCKMAATFESLGQYVKFHSIAARCKFTSNRTDDNIYRCPALTSYRSHYIDGNLMDGAVHVSFNGSLLKNFMCGATCWEDEGFNTRNLIDHLNDYGMSNWGFLRSNDPNMKNLVVPIGCGGTLDGVDGGGTESAPFLVHNEEELRNLQQKCDRMDGYSGKIIKLMNDINMGNEQMGAFRNFSGVFDGNGHYIQNLHAAGSCLFGTVSGVVKNLTLKDISFTNRRTSSYAGIAYKLTGTPQKKGMIENCVVTGVLNIDHEPVIKEDKVSIFDFDYSYMQWTYLKDNFDGKEGYFIGGIVACQDENAVIHNCLFDGDINYNCHKLSSVEANKYYPLFLGGIAAYSKGMITNCTAVVGGHCNTKGPIGCVNGLIGFQAENHDNSNYKDNEYMMTGWEQHNESSLYGNVNVYKRYYGGEYRSYEDLCNLLGRKTGWVKTVNGGTPPNTCCFDAVDPNGRSVKISLTDFYRSSVADNTVYRITPREDQVKSESMYKLPNVVVYSKDINADMIMNGVLTPGKSLRYKAQNDSVKTYGMMKYEIKPNKTGWHSLCLPGTVSTTMLPGSSKLYICGPNNGTKMMVVEVDSVPGGIPFFAYVPVKNKKGEDQTAVLNMKGQLVMTPRKACDNTPMQGTYKQIKVEGACSKLSDDGRMLSVNPDIEPFSGYAVNSTPLQLVERLMMEEHDDNITGTIKENMGYKLNLAVSRDFKAHEWTPICLPFDMDKDEIKKSFGEKAMLESFKGVDYDEENEILNLNFSAASCRIDAGKPYLIKPSVDVKGFALNNCKLVDTPRESATYKVKIKGKQARVAFVGSFEKQLLVSTTEYNAYYMMNQKSLAKASAETPYQNYAFRGWFRATDAEGVKPYALGTARIVHEANEFTIEDDGKTDIPAEAYGTYAKGKLKYHRAIETDSLHTSLVLPFDVMKKDVDSFCDEIYVVKRVNRMANDKYDIMLEPVGNMGKNDMLDHNNAYYVKLKKGVEEIEFVNDDVADLTKIYVSANRTQVIQITTGGGAAVTEAPQYMAFGPSMCNIDDKSYCFYMFGDDGTLNRVDSVPPFRLYFYLSDSDGNPYIQQSQAKIKMMGKTTGISEVKTANAFKPRRLYTLDGKSESQNGKGIYIRDGKKIAVQ